MIADKSKTKGRFLGLELIKAVRENDIERAAELVELTGPDAGVKEKGGFVRPLSEALGRKDMMNFFLEKGADVDFHAGRGMRFVNKAINELRGPGHEKLLDKIISGSKMAKISYISKRHVKSVGIAASAAVSGRIRLYNDFISRGAVFGPADFDYIATSSPANKTLANMALLRAIKQETGRQNLSEILEHAAGAGNHGAAAVLLKRGADPDSVEPGLHYVITPYTVPEPGDIDKRMMEIFLENGFDIKKYQDGQFKLVMSIALLRGGIEYAKATAVFLVRCGACIKRGEEVFKDRLGDELEENKSKPAREIARIKNTTKAMVSFIRALNNPKQMNLF